MGFLQIRDDAIWVKHIEGDEKLRRRLMELDEADIVELDIDGLVGIWQKMRNGRDGRPTSGVKPLGPMREAWKRMQARRGEIVPIREAVAADTDLEALSPLFSEWNSPQDEAAFRDL